MARTDRTMDDYLWGFRLAPFDRRRGGSRGDGAGLGMMVAAVGAGLLLVSLGVSGWNTTLILVGLLLAVCCGALRGDAELTPLVMGLALIGWGVGRQVDDAAGAGGAGSLMGLGASLVLSWLLATVSRRRPASVLLLVVGLVTGGAGAAQAAGALHSLPWVPIVLILLGVSMAVSSSRGSRPQE